MTIRGIQSARNRQQLRNITESLFGQIGVLLFALGTAGVRASAVPETSQNSHSNISSMISSRLLAWMGWFNRSVQSLERMK
jgi:hypothetical protein